VVLALGGCNRVPRNIDFARMIDQVKFEAFEADFATRFSPPDKGVMRHPPAGTVARERSLDPALRGELRDGEYRQRIPVSVDRKLLERGRDRFERFCAACHGISGHGNEPVVRNMALRPAPSLHEPRIRRLSPGHIFIVISEGYGLMPSYQDDLEPRDRWAVIAYLQVLWLSQGVELASLPDALQTRARRELP
jgi:mono/diheme cytochrome c family protein